MTAPVPVHTWTFVAACATAGALSLPLHPAATPVSAAIAALLGLLGLYAWHWSRLPCLIQPQARRRANWLAGPATWLGVGLSVGLLLLAAIRLAIEPAVPAIAARMAAAGVVPIWRRVLIIYVAAVGEELVFRLLMLSVIAGVTARLVRLPDRVPTQAVVWSAAGISAFLFAAVHLPAWSGVAPLTPGLALSVLTLNAIGGAGFGYAFVNRGLGQVAADDHQRPMAPLSSSASASVRRTPDGRQCSAARSLPHRPS